ncbi:MAG: aldehyde reductase [Pseudomonadales bacterium]
MADKILVSGASGFIAGHCILELLNHGYEVRGTVRNLERADQLRTVLGKHTDKADSVEFVQADLLDQESWHAAVQDCNGVFHVASPVPIEQPENADEVVKPAREGTLNVLSAARNAGIRRVVLTSSVAAVSASDTRSKHIYTDKDWTDLDSPHLSPYDISKTVAEKAAWDFVVDNDGPELATINPAFVLGPALEADYGSSLEALVRLLRGDYPLVPRLGFGIVDVRDVAALHRLVYESPEAAGNRYICSNGFRWLVDIARYLRDEFPEYKKKLPHREAPNWLVRILARFDKAIAALVDDLGKTKQFDNSPAKALGWQPRSPEEAASAGAKSLIDYGVV